MLFLGISFFEFFSQSQEAVLAKQRLPATVSFSQFGSGFHNSTKCISWYFAYFPRPICSKVLQISTKYCVHLSNVDRWASFCFHTATLCSYPWKCNYGYIIVKYFWDDFFHTHTKHRKNCECCPGYYLIVNHYSSI